MSPLFMKPLKMITYLLNIPIFSYGWGKNLNIPLHTNGEIYSGSFSLLPPHQ